MPLFMLDTNVAGAIVRGSPQAEARLQALSRDEWCISAVTRSELRFGLELMPRPAALASLIEAFLDLAPTAPWEKAAADEHAKLRAKLRQSGRSIGAYDAMIAAHALCLRAVLVTNNARDFGQVDDLATENWLLP